MKYKKAIRVNKNILTQKVKFANYLFVAFKMELKKDHNVPESTRNDILKNLQMCDNAFAKLRDGIPLVSQNPKSNMVSWSFNLHVISQNLRQFVEAIDQELSDDTADFLGDCLDGVADIFNYLIQCMQEAGIHAN